MHKTVQKAFEKIGYRGKYQKLLVAFLFFIAAEVNCLLFAPSFIFMNPLFDCSFADGLVDESVACSRLSQCKISSDFTIVAAAQLYCDKQIERNVIQSTLSIGSIVGLLLVNYVSDKKGKKIAIIIVQAVAILGVSLTVVGGYTASVAILTISQFFCGFSGYSMMMMAYMLPYEYCDDEYRQKLVITINFAWSLTVVLTGVLYYVYNQWFNFLILFVLIPAIGIFLVSLFFVVQGPNFLYSQKREKECLQSLKTIAIYNNAMRQYEQVVNSFKYESSQIKEQYKAVTFRQVAKNRHYIKIIIVLILIQIGGNLYYFGANYALDIIGLDYGTNMISTGLIQLCAYILLQFIITKFPRKKGLILLQSIMVGLGFLFYIKPLQQDVVVSLIIIGIIRFFGTIAYTIIMLLLTESFPVQVQGTCSGIVESVAQLGVFLGPVVNTFCINNQIYPIIALSFIQIVLIVIPLFAFEERKEAQSTLNHSLVSQQSIEDSK